MRDMDKWCEKVCLSSFCTSGVGGGVAIEKSICDLDGPRTIPDSAKRDYQDDLDVSVVTVFRLAGDTLKHTGCSSFGQVHVPRV